MGAHMRASLIAFKLAVAFESWSLVTITSIFLPAYLGQNILLNQTSISSTTFFITEMNKVILYEKLTAYQNWEEIGTTIKPFV